VELRLTAADVQDAIDGTFPTVTADKIINDTVVGRTIPVGGIVMWSGSILSIPAGWALCDGTNGTPNLRDKFIMGAGSAYSPGAQGGSADATLVAHTHTFSATTGTESADHTHTGYTDVQGAHAHNYTAPGASSLDDRNGSNSYPMDPVTRSTDTQGAHQHNVQTYGNSVAHTHNVAGTADSAGASPTGANLPPFFALAYIMALGY
jgi:microcystin-dependent protein